MIWLIGGTSDALKIADLLLSKKKDVLVSTTTNYGTQLANKTRIEIIQKKLKTDEMISVINDYSIDIVIDASHPFSCIVSQNAIDASKNTGIKYFRFERETALIENVMYYSCYSKIIDVLNKTEGNILLTIGSKNIYQFNSLPNERIIARVLPVKESFELCDAAGLKAHQIIAMKGRMSMETNEALMIEYNIKHLVTKDSGEAGGLYEKVNAAKKLGISVHVLKRPSIEYPVLYNSFNKLIHNI